MHDMVVCAIVVISVVQVLIVGIPVLVGKLFLHWSKARVKYIFMESLKEISVYTLFCLVATVLSIVLGYIFEEARIFEPILLFGIVFIVAIKIVKEKIRISKKL